MFKLAQGAKKSLVLMQVFVITLPDWLFMSHSDILKVHYARAMKESEPEDHSGLKLTITDIKPKYSQGILLLISDLGIIPAHTKSKLLLVIVKTQIARL